MATLQVQTFRRWAGRSGILTAVLSIPVFEVTYKIFDHWTPWLHYLYLSSFSPVHQLISIAGSQYLYQVGDVTVTKRRKYVIFALFIIDICLLCAEVIFWSFLPKNLRGVAWSSEIQVAAAICVYATIINIGAILILNISAFIIAIVTTQQPRTPESVELHGQSSVTQLDHRQAQTSVAAGTTSHEQKMDDALDAEKAAMTQAEVGSIAGRSTPYRDFFQKWIKDIFGVHVIEGTSGDGEQEKRRTSIRIAGSIAAISLFLALVIFGVTVVFVEPIAEENSSVKLSTAGYIAVDQRHNFDLPVWSITAYTARFSQSPPYQSQISLDALVSAVTVTPLWDNGYESRPPCVNLPDQSQYLRGVVDKADSPVNPQVASVTFYCPPREAETYANVADFPSYIANPELLITVNYTALGLPSTVDVFGNIQNLTVSVLVGLTNTTSEVITNTSPMPLHPGVHLSGGVLRTVRSQLQSASTPSLGIFGNSKRSFFLAQLTSVVPDSSQSVPQGSNIATLRVYDVYDFSAWKAYEDYKEKSVLSGLASAGGFWTSLNGLYTFLFGGSLLLILYGEDVDYTGGGFISTLFPAQPIEEDT